MGHIITTQSNPTAISVMLTCTHAGTVGPGLELKPLCVFFAKTVVDMEASRAISLRKRLYEGISNTFGSK
jgi:hypothetical protein